MQAYTGLLGQASNVAAQPLQQYAGPTIAGFSPAQMQAFGTINNAQGMAQPYLNQAGAYYSAGAQPITPMTFSKEAIDALMSPYIGDVVDTTQAQFNEGNAQQVANIQGNAAIRGAYGGDREAVVQALTAGQQATAQSPVIANLYNQGYGQALGQFNALNQAQIGAQQATGWLQQGAAAGYGNLGLSAQNAAISGANAQLAAGQQQQQMAQSQLNMPYQYFQQQQAYPYQSTGWYGNEVLGVGSGMGGVGTTTAPPPSTLGQVAGLGVAGYGLYNALDSGSSGGEPSGFIPSDFGGGDHRGGRVGYAAGGGLETPYSAISVSSSIPDFSLTPVPTSTASTGRRSPFFNAMQPNTSATNNSSSGIMGAIGPALTLAKLFVLRDGGRVHMADGGNPVAPIVHAAAPTVAIPPSPQFDRAYYLQANPDVAAAGMDPYQHYAQYGFQEGRAPSASGAGFVPATMNSIRPMENYAPTFDANGYPTAMQAVPNFYNAPTPLSIPLSNGALNRGALNPAPAVTGMTVPVAPVAPDVPFISDTPTWTGNSDAGGWRGGVAGHFDSGGYVGSGSGGDLVSQYLALPIEKLQELAMRPATPGQESTRQAIIRALQIKRSSPAATEQQSAGFSPASSALSPSLVSRGGRLGYELGGDVQNDRVYNNLNMWYGPDQARRAMSYNHYSDLPEPVLRSITREPSTGEGETWPQYQVFPRAVQGAFDAEAEARDLALRGRGRDDDLLRALQAVRERDAEGGTYPRINGMSDVIDWPQGSMGFGGRVGYDDGGLVTGRVLPDEVLDLPLYAGVAGERADAREFVVPPTVLPPEKRETALISGLKPVDREWYFPLEPRERSSNSVDLQRAMRDPLYRKEIMPDVTSPGSSYAPPVIDRRSAPPVFDASEGRGLLRSAGRLLAGSPETEAVARGVSLDQVMSERNARYESFDVPDPEYGTLTLPSQKPAEPVVQDSDLAGFGDGKLVTAAPAGANYSDLGLSAPAPSAPVAPVAGVSAPAPEERIVGITGQDGTAYQLTQAEAGTFYETQRKQGFAAGQNYLKSLDAAPPAAPAPGLGVQPPALMPPESGLGSGLHSPGTPPQRNVWQPSGSSSEPSGLVTPSRAAVISAGRNDPRGKVPVIRAAAIKYGHNPDDAVRVAASEGLTTPNGDYVNGKPTSFGAMQLHIGGGMGDEFKRDTGLDPADPKNEDATIDYAMSRVGQTGWTPWHGAARVGIGKWQGIGTGSGAGGLPPQDELIGAGNGTASRTATTASDKYTLPPLSDSKREPGLGQNKWLPLIAAGLGMMASRSPNALGAIGEGGLAGVKLAHDQEAQAAKLQELHNSEDYKNRHLSLEAARLNQTVDYQSKELAQKADQFTRQLQKDLTLAGQAATREERLAARDHALGTYQAQMAAVAQQNADRAQRHAEQQASEKIIEGTDDKPPYNRGRWRIVRGADGIEKREFFPDGRADVVTADQRQKSIISMAEKTTEWITDPTAAIAKATETYDKTFGRPGLSSNSPLKVTTQEQINSAPSGTYLDVNGKVYRKP